VGGLGRSIVGPGPPDLRTTMRRRQRVFEPRIEEGSTEPPGARETPALVKPAPCPSLGGARPMLLGEAIPRAPSLHRGGALPGAPSSPRKRRRPRKGYAERVVRRHGSLASSHDRKKMPVVPVQDGGLPPHQTCMVRGGWKHPQRVNEVTGLALLHGRARMGERKLGPQRGQRRKLRAEEDSRLAGVPARRSCVAEIGRQTQAHRSRLKARCPGESRALVKSQAGPSQVGESRRDESQKTGP